METPNAPAQTEAELKDPTAAVEDPEQAAGDRKSGDANDFAFSSDEDKKSQKSAKRRDDEPRKEDDRRSANRESSDRGERNGRREGRRDRDRHDGHSRSGKIRFPSLRSPQMTYREFENYQDGKFSRHDLREAFNDYLALYNKEFQYDFYRRHRNEPWFAERYDPSAQFKLKEVLKKHAQRLSESFQAQIEAMSKDSDAELHKLCLTQQEPYDYNLLTDGDGKEVELSGAPHFGFDSDETTLYLKYLPLDIRRLSLTEKLEKEAPGFCHLSLSEPMRNHQYERIGWATFDTAEHMEAAVEKIGELVEAGHQLSALKSQSNKKRAPVRICPPLPEQQIEADFELCKLLITQVLDAEKEIETWVAAAVEALPDASTELKLDLLLLYMRRVHAFCLYSGEEYEDERMLASRNGPQHIRNAQKIAAAEFATVCTVDEKIDNPLDRFKAIANLDASKSNSWRGSFNFLSKYVTAAVQRIEKGPQKNVDPQQKFIEADLEEFCRTRVECIENGKKYKCKFCGKCFMAEHFVINHIKNRHQDQIDEIYERESTQQWLEETIQKEMKKEMKANFYKDAAKFFERPGRKYSPNESSYYHQQKDEERKERKGGKNTKDYVDYDDPAVNKSMQRQKKSRDQVDYGDLFG
jgi:hypothetical protein